MKINTKELIKHDKNTDVAFLPLVTVQTQCGLKLQGWWVNIVNRPFLIDKDQIFIKNKDLPSWKPIKQK